MPCFGVPALAISPPAAGASPRPARLESCPGLVTPGFEVVGGPDGDPAAGIGFVGEETLSGRFADFAPPAGLSADPGLSPAPCLPDAGLVSAEGLTSSSGLGSSPFGTEAAAPPPGAGPPDVFAKGSRPSAVLATGSIAVAPSSAAAGSAAFERVNSVEGRSMVGGLRLRGSLPRVSLI